MEVLNSQQRKHNPDCAQSSQTSLQSLVAAMDQTLQLKDEDTRVCANLSPPHVVPSLVVSVQTFQLGDFHAMCWVMRCIDYVAHTPN
jgi:hypothetical protein